jgi:general stress protein 26
MDPKTLIQKASTILKGREFVYLATSGPKGRPNCAPKLYLKIDQDGCIYLADYVLGRVYNDIKADPRVSLCVMDNDDLIGYQINGMAQLLGSGQEYEQLLSELSDLEIKLSTRRIVEGVRRQKKHAYYEVAFPEKAVIIKIKLRDVATIGPTGLVKRQAVKKSL